MDIRKLQRTIVDALEDVKAQDIQVFNTEALTSLFDRVIVASGSSNRQTRSLAASVRDKVRAVGGTVKNPEGEGSGEWVLVDCGDAVVHIMQPVIRAYYKLEDIWGGKSVHLKAKQDALATAPAKSLRASPGMAGKVSAPGSAWPGKQKATSDWAGDGAAAAKPRAKTPAKAPAKASVGAPAKAAATKPTAKPARSAAGSTAKPRVITQTLVVAAPAPRKRASNTTAKGTTARSASNAAAPRRAATKKSTG